MTSKKPARATLYALYKCHPNKHIHVQMRQTSMSFLTSKVPSVTNTLWHKNVLPVRGLMPSTAEVHVPRWIVSVERPLLVVQATVRGVIVRGIILKRMGHGKSLE